MLDDVVAVQPTGAKGAELVPLWEADYRTYLDDRREFSDDLRAGSDEPFAETVVDGIPISEKVDALRHRQPHGRPAPRRPTSASVVGPRSSRITFAGLPAAMQKSGISPRTTLLAPITTWRPIVAPGQHDGAVAEPRAVADAHRALGHQLHGDRPVEVLVAVVLVGDVDVVARPHVVADLDRQVADDPAAAPDQAAVADAHDGVGHALLAGHHARRQRHVGPDQRAGADVDVALVDEGRRREADHAAVAERAEALAPSRVRADRAELLDLLPRAVHDLAGGPLHRRGHAGATACPGPVAVAARAASVTGGCHDGRVATGTHRPAQRHAPVGRRGRPGGVARRHGVAGRATRPTSSCTPVTSCSRIPTT